MRGHGVASGSSRTVADENVHDAWREPGFVDERGHTKSGEGSEFGRLEDEGVSASKSGTDLPAYQHNYMNVRRGRKSSRLNEEPTHLLRTWPSCDLPATEIRLSQSPSQRNP